MIVTHLSPDWDAITACWLLQRHDGWGHEDVVFVNTGNPDPTLLADATAVLDTGKVFEPMRLRFDHHQFEGKAASATCAAEQVFTYLNQTGAMDFLLPLIRLVTAGDCGSPLHGADYSRNVGMHLELSAMKARKKRDHELLVWGYAKLDLIAEGLQAQRDARASIDAHTVYRSQDSLLIALDNAPRGATSTAYEQGVRIVVWANDQTEGTHGVGVNRSNEWGEISCGELVQKTAYLEGPGPLADELRSWYCHPSGFFAGRGTEKAPRPDPVFVPLAEIAAAIDMWWSR